MTKKKSSLNKKEKYLIELLRERPEMFERIESILSIAIEPCVGPVRSADEVESLLIEEIRKLGKETLESWARAAEQKVSEELKSSSRGLEQREKKRLKWWSSYGQVEVKERIWRDPNRSYIRIFPDAIKVTERGCSKRLERVISDFGFEHSFKTATRCVKEHYGFEISETTLANVTRKHAQGIAAVQNARANLGALPAQGVEKIIAQTDGSLLRIVETKPSADRRRTRKVDYQEVRLSAATAQGCERIYYEGTFRDVDQSGQFWAHAAQNAGWALNSKIHALGDGATWICSQAERIFGKQGNFTIDFYHLCEYLNAAAESCSDKPHKWMKTQKKRLKKGRYDKVIDTLKIYLESENIPDKKAPVRKAFRYMSNRTNYFQYDRAIAQELPIGSGLIESGHKHVLQARLKIPGASWNINNAEAFVQARVFRANGLWNQYWTKKAA